MRFAKGHGTGNDFVILPDPDGRLDLSPQVIARICDRRTGLGADGLLRVVRSAAGGHFPGTAAAARAEQDSRSGAEWFMDYRNGDGSVAEMCGNGIRVFARYLLDRGLSTGPELAVGTRAGVRLVRETACGDISTDMGPARVTGTGSARLGDRVCAGLAISVGNPHLACVVNEPVAGFDLSAPPVLAPGQFPEGANVEVLRLTGDRRVEMRVHERGSGVTLSCGTGAVAAAVSASVAAGEWRTGPERTWTVDVPGGRLVVTPSATTSWLTGPAVIVAEGDLNNDWLRDAAGWISRAAGSGLLQAGG
jgi:diaminopimelate epimerase